jgi:5'-nucleotidase/UDP-sugar diphosphatase
MRNRTHTRRVFLAGSTAAGTAILIGGSPATAADGRKLTFTILHTNDLHSNLIGMGPAADYTPFTLNDDQTIGGFARLATLIDQRREARKDDGPVLVLDAGDYSMGTAFGGAIRDTGAELQLLYQMGYDATTFGNHDFDLGPDGLGKAIEVAAKAGRIPPLVSSNANFEADDEALADLQRQFEAGLIRRYIVIERDGVRFGIFGVLGKEAVAFTSGAGAVSFDDFIERSKETVDILRNEENVDVVICLSHGGIEKGEDDRYSSGDDVHLPEEVPGIDVVIGSHSHVALDQAIMVNGRTPVVQAGKYGEYLGELVLTLDGETLTVDSYQLIPVDDSIQGDKAISDEIDKFKKIVTEVMFASRGYSIDQPLAVAPRDLPIPYDDIAAGDLLANLVTDATRQATKADISFTCNALMRTGLSRGKTGVQTVYDVYAVASIGTGVVDPTAGSTLVTGYFTGQELKNILEFFLVINPASGELFPRVSGLKFKYDLSRPSLDAVTTIEAGNFDEGYRAIDITGQDDQLFSLTCPLQVSPFISGIPELTKGKLSVVAKNKDGEPLKSSVEALKIPGEHKSTPDLVLRQGSVDRESIVTEMENDVILELKEWQAIMDYLVDLPKKPGEEFPTIPVDERASEVRAIREG